MTLNRLINSVKALLEYRQYFDPTFHGVYMELTALMSDIVANIARCERAEIPTDVILETVAPVRRLQAESPFVRRLQEWPRGYEGDYETVEYLLSQSNKAAKDSLAWYIEMHALGTMIAQQHRNKVTYQSELILETVISRQSQRCVKILLIAAGGAPDLRRIVPYIAHSNCYFVLNDIDPDALRFARIELHDIRDKCCFVEGNVLARSSTLAEFGMFDLVIAGGLCDYLKDRAVQLLVKIVLTKLSAPDGIFLFTNLATGNPYRCWLEYLANWHLIERNEQYILGLLEPMQQFIKETQFFRDPTGLTVFAHIRNVQDKGQGSISFLGK